MAAVFRLFLALSVSLESAIASVSPLTPSPALLESNITQCGCNNSALYALTPTSLTSATINVSLTAFFYIDSNNDSLLCGEQQSISTSGHLIPAALIALDEINNSSDILPGYHLTLDLRDSKCDPVHATTELIDSVADRIKGSDPPPRSFNLGIIGPGCAAVTETVSGVVSRSLKLPVVSYGLNSHAVSREGKSFSTLFNLPRSILSSMLSAIRVVKYFNWTDNIAFASENTEDFFLSTIESVVQTDGPNNDIIILDDGSGAIPVSQFEVFQVQSSNGLVPLISMQNFFNNVRTNSIRVILALLSQRIAVQLICTGKMGTIPGDGFVYVFAGTFSENWWQTETGYCNLTSVDVQSVIIVSGNFINPNISATLASGKTVHDFKVEYAQRERMWCGNSRNSIDPSAGLVYDAVWSIALALNQTTNLADPIVEQYDHDTLVGIVEALESISFTGVTGQIEFTGGDRDGAESIQQVQNGHQVVVGLYFEDGLELSRDFVWNGSSDVIPSDSVTVDASGVDLYWIVICSVFTLAGVVFAILMWIFNWRFHKHKILRASSQKLNYVIIIGVFFGYLTVLILTILESPLGGIMDDDAFKALCVIRIWMLPLAFTFTYGVLFARAWRIYRIFNNPWVSSRPYKDVHLLLIVLVIAAIDAAILLPWTIIDPYRRNRVLTEVDYDSFSRSVFSSCSSTNIIAWLSVLSIYKIVIILVGILVISLVRRGIVERKIFDDSKSLSVAVYITAVAFVLGLTLTLLFLLADQVLLSYIASSTWVNIVSSGTLVCVFLPKVYRIVIKKDTGDSYRAAGRLYYGRAFSRATIADDINTTVTEVEGVITESTKL